MNEDTSNVPATIDKDTRNWATILHLSQLAGFVIPFAGLIAPIVIWQVKKDALPGIDAHGKIVVNWLISAVIYFAVCIVLSFIFVGIPLMFMLGILAIVFPIIGAIKASEDKLWKYPLSIEILKD